MGLFLVIVGGLTLWSWRVLTRSVRTIAPAPVLVRATALDNVYEHLEAPKPKRSHHKKKPIVGL